MTCVHEHESLTFHTIQTHNLLINDHIVDNLSADGTLPV